METPNLGDIKSVPCKHGANKSIWAACVMCGKERWVPLKKEKPAYNKCLKCGTKLFRNYAHAR